MDTFDISHVIADDTNIASSKKYEFENPLLCSISKDMCTFILKLLPYFLWVNIFISRNSKAHSLGFGNLASSFSWYIPNQLHNYIHLAGAENCMSKNIEYLLYYLSFYIYYKEWFSNFQYHVYLYYLFLSHTFPTAEWEKLAIYYQLFYNLYIQDIKEEFYKNHIVYNTHLRSVWF